MREPHDPGQQMLVEHPLVPDAPDNANDGILPGDLYETPTAYVVRALLPGVTPGKSRRVLS